jgi:hypothetical protein
VPAASVKTEEVTYDSKKFIFGRVGENKEGLLLEGGAATSLRFLCLLSLRRGRHRLQELFHTVGHWLSGWSGGRGIGSDRSDVRWKDFCRYVDGSNFAQNSDEEPARVLQMWQQAHAAVEVKTLGLLSGWWQH